jgi:hypothetical protein
MSKPAWLNDSEQWADRPWLCSGGLCICCGKQMVEGVTWNIDVPENYRRPDFPFSEENCPLHTRLLDLQEVAELPCPKAYGFEGLDTFTDCGICIVCRARAALNTRDSPDQR